MLTIPKTIIDYSFKHWDKLIFEAHTDYDLANYVDALAIKSIDGTIHNFYREVKQNTHMIFLIQLTINYLTL